MFCTIFLLEAFCDWCFEQVPGAIVLQILPSNLLALLPVMFGFWIQGSNSLFQPCILAERVIYYSIKSNLLCFC